MLQGGKGRVCLGAACSALRRAESPLEKPLCESSPLSWPKFSVPIKWHWSCGCYKKKSLVVACKSCSHQEYHNKAIFTFAVFFSCISGFSLLHSALFGISKMALITQAVRDVGAAGLAAPLWGGMSPIRHPTFCRNNNSASCKTLAGHKHDCETFSCTPNTKFSLNSPLAPLWRRAMIHTAATHTLTRQNKQPQEHGCSEFPTLLTKAAAYKSLEKPRRQW